MNLTETCRQLISAARRNLQPGHPLGARMISFEYSKSAKEIKTYPLLSSQRIFFLCWDFCGRNQLRAAMYPAPDRFCCCFTFEDGVKTQLHTHDYIELGYVVKGNFKQKISGKDIIFQEGDVCLIDKNCIHQDYLSCQDSIVLFFGIENSMFEEVMNEHITTGKIISFLQTALMKQSDLQQYIHFHPARDARKEIEPCLSLLLTELYENKIGSTHICRGLLLRIFRILSTHYDFSLTRERQKNINWTVFEEICSYIQTHYQSVTTHELMERFHFQRDYFNRLIRKKTGMTYSEYLQNIRLEQAKRLLIETELTISEIAEQVGYRNKGYFYQLFVEKYNMTPGKYKKRMLEHPRNPMPQHPE